jgi:hypothetical protein
MMPEYICYMEDTTVTSIRINAPDMDEAEKRLDRILEAHGFDSREIAEAHDGEHHEGDLNTYIYPVKTDLTSKWTDKMHEDDLND